MRKAAVVSLLAFFAAPVLCAQAKDSGPVTITPQQCVWRAGDNPAWTSADLDEAGNSAGSREKDIPQLARNHGFGIGIEANHQVGCGVP